MGVGWQSRMKVKVDGREEYSIVYVSNMRALLKDLCVSLPMVLFKNRHAS